MTVMSIRWQVDVMREKYFRRKRGEKKKNCTYLN